MAVIGFTLVARFYNLRNEGIYTLYVIIFYQNWTKYMYVALVLKGTMSNIIFKYPHVCEELFYLLK